MRAYALRRSLAMVPVVLGILFFIMFTVELIPGDPVALMLGENAREEEVVALRKHLGLDQPLLVRYVKYVGQLLTGDLGRSIRENRPVADELADVYPQTMMLTGAGIIIAVTLGVSTGVFSAARPYGWGDNILRFFTLLGLSMPVFWIGLVLIFFFSYYFRIFPVGGTGTVMHLVLPAITLALPSTAMISRMTRSSLLEIMGEDYIRTARSKGLSERIVLFKHAFKNALIPVLTLIGLQFGQMLGGSILTETVFAIPGLGRLMVRAIFARDYVLLQGAVLLFALAFVVVNLMVDLSYAYVDPRVHYS
jgi:peptide/nickel transport system permease protein